MQKKLIFLLLIIQYFHPTMLLANNQEELQEEITFEEEIDNEISLEDEFRDDWGLDDIEDDFLVAADPSSQIYLIGLKVGSLLLYCCYQVEKSIRYSYSKTMRILRVKKEA